MPAGVSWPGYLTFFAVSFATCLAGSQVVHLYYRPNLVRLFCFLCFMIHEHRRSWLDKLLFDLPMFQQGFLCNSCTSKTKLVWKISWVIFVCLQWRNLTLYSQDLCFFYSPKLLYITFVISIFWNIALPLLSKREIIISLSLIERTACFHLVDMFFIWVYDQLLVCLQNPHGRN